MHNKGTISENIIYLAIYLVMSLMIVYLIKIVPTTIFAKTIQTQEQESIIYTERIYDFLSEKDEHTRQTIIGKASQLKKINQEFNDFNSIKHFAALIEFNNEKEYYNQEFYEDAAPLAPGKYKLFTAEKPTLNNSKIKINTVFSTKLKNE